MLILINVNLFIPQEYVYHVCWLVQGRLWLCHSIILQFATWDYYPEKELSLYLTMLPRLNKNQELGLRRSIPPDFSRICGLTPVVGLWSGWDLGSWTKHVKLKRWVQNNIFQYKLGFKKYTFGPMHQVRVRLQPEHIAWCKVFPGTLFYASFRFFFTFKGDIWKS